MQKRLLPLLLAAAGLATALGAHAADTPQEAAIKARQGVMHIRAFNLGPLVAMAKKEIEYDAQAAQTHANNIQALNALDLRSAWMPGTSADDYMETRAKAALWTKMDEFADYGKKEAEAATALAQVAGTDLKTMTPAVQKLAQSCKSCHDDFRTD